MKKKPLYITLIFLIVISAYNCKTPNDHQKNGEVLATVGLHNLYSKDLPDIASESTTAIDSAALINGFIEQWIRKHVMVDAAESTLSSTIDIESLVKDYRSSLLISNYKQQYIEENLDTTITDEQLNEEYEIIGSNFKLSEPIYKINIAKVDNKMTGIEGFYKNWKAGNMGKVNTYCKERAMYYDLGENWKTLSEIRVNLPQKVISTKRLKKNRDIQQYKDGFEYFVKVIDSKDEESIPPLSYIRYKIQELVIHKRKKKMLEKLESDMYTKAITTNKIKVYNK